MRDIKFRAWDKENKHMTYNIQEMYDGYCDDTDNGLYGYMSCFTSFLYDENFIVMQYTGLKDMNGKEIYEGDIIRYPAKRSWENENFTSYIVWFDDRPEWGIEYKLRAQFHGALCGGYVESNLKNANKMLKIGNIFENPELIKVGR